MLSRRNLKCTSADMRKDWGEKLGIESRKAGLVGDHVLGLSFSIQILLDC